MAPCVVPRPHPPRDLGRPPLLRPAPFPGRIVTVVFPDEFQNVLHVQQTPRNDFVHGNGTLPRHGCNQAHRWMTGLPRRSPLLSTAAGWLSVCMHHRHSLVLTPALTDMQLLPCGLLDKELEALVVDRRRAPPRRGGLHVMRAHEQVHVGPQGATLGRLQALSLNHCGCGTGHTSLA